MTPIPAPLSVSRFLIETLLPLKVLEMKIRSRFQEGPGWEKAP